MKAKHNYPHSVYYDEYHKRPHFERNKINHPPYLRIQDEFAALCYAMGAVKEYDEVEYLMGLEKYGSYVFCKPSRVSHRNRYDKYISKNGSLPDGFIGGGDTVLRLDWSAVDQINCVLKNSTRKPNKVLDMGGGNGLLASCFSHMGIKSTNVDPSKRVDFDILEQSNLLSVDFIEQIEDDLGSYDTLIFCASIEHMPIEYSIEIIERVSPDILIIVNTLCNHPIDVGQEANPLEHCAKIDNILYDRICSMFPKVIYREESHLVVGK